MPLSRRSFLGESAAVGLWASLLAHPEIADALNTATARLPMPATAGEIYWKNLYAGAGERSRGTTTPDPKRDPLIAQCSDTSGLRWAEDIKPTELPSFNEDAVVTMELTGFRAGSQDKSKLAKVRFAQMHLSCQRVTQSEFLGPIVWAALATLFTSKANKLPSEQSVTWSALAGKPAQPAEQSMGPKLNHMVLNQGAGHLSVNITTTPTTSLLDKILSVTVQTAAVMSPLLGFPGIALPALQNFYIFYGQLEKADPANFLINGAQKDVAVTQQGVDSSLISANALKLLGGSYVLVPKEQEGDFQKQMDKLVVQNGYLVERDAKGTPDERVAQAIPTVSYVVLNVKVVPASSFPSTSTVTDPLLDSKPQTPTQDTTKPAGSKQGSSKKPGTPPGL